MKWGLGWAGGQRGHSCRSRLSQATVWGEAPTAGAASHAGLGENDA